MAVINFAFTQIVAERNKAIKGGININTHLSIEDVKEKPLNEQKAVVISFSFSADYSPDLGRLSIKGEITYIFSSETTEKILKTWKDKKVLPDDIIPIVYNYILNKCHVEGVVISRDVGLPPPIPMPSVKPRNKEGDYIG